LSNAGSNVEAVGEFTIHPDRAFCTLIIVAQDVDDFGWYSIYQHPVPHGLAMHFVKGSQKVNEDGNELLATSDSSLEDPTKSENLVHASKELTCQQQT